MKSIILGRKVWNSLTLRFQREIHGDAEEFTKGEEYDGVLLWDYLHLVFCIQAESWPPRWCLQCSYPGLSSLPRDQVATRPGPVT